MIPQAVAVVWATFNAPVFRFGLSLADVYAARDAILRGGIGL